MPDARGCRTAPGQTLAASAPLRHTVAAVHDVSEAPAAPHDTSAEAADLTDRTEAPGAGFDRSRRPPEYAAATSALRRRLLIAIRGGQSGGERHEGLLVRAVRRRPRQPGHARRAGNARRHAGVRSVTTRLHRSRHRPAAEGPGHGIEGRAGAGQLQQNGRTSLRSRARSLLREPMDRGQGQRWRDRAGRHGGLGEGRHLHREPAAGRRRSGSQAPVDQATKQTGTVPKRDPRHAAGVRPRSRRSARTRRGVVRSTSRSSRRPVPTRPRKPRTRRPSPP